MMYVFMVLGIIILVAILVIVIFIMIVRGMGAQIKELNRTILIKDVEINNYKREITKANDITKIIEGGKHAEANIDNVNNNPNLMFNRFKK